MVASSNDATVTSIYGESAGENVPNPVSAFDHVNRAARGPEALVPAKPFRLFGIGTTQHRSRRSA